MLDLFVIVRTIPAGLVLAAIAAGCAPPPAPSHATRATAAESGPREARLTRRATLYYEIGGRDFPLPIVKGTIAGHPVQMLVDTGANSHWVAGWLARELGLPMHELGDVGTDHVGKAIATYRIDDPRMTIDGWGPLSAGPVLATDVPKVVEKLGIGAFISPQRLASEGDAVVLDLARGELRAAPWDEAFASLSASGAALVLERDPGRTCERTEGPVEGLEFIVPASVDAHRVELLVDTGKQRSDVFTSSAAGKALLDRSVGNREAMYTASGKIQARTVRGAKVAAGELLITTDLDLIAGGADEGCPRDGVLEMDVLRSCALLLGRARLYGRCAAPAR